MKKVLCVITFVIFICTLLISCDSKKSDSSIVPEENAGANETVSAPVNASDLTETVVLSDTEIEVKIEKASTLLVEEPAEPPVMLNKYFSENDLLIARPIAETIGVIDEEHFLAYFKQLIQEKADEKISSYNPYQEKILSRKTFAPLTFSDGYSFVPEELRLQVSDTDIETMHKYEEYTYEYDGDKETEICVDEDGLSHISSESKDRLYYYCRYFESETTYEYDEKGNRTAVIDSDEGRTEYLYDKDSNCIKKIYPSQEVETYEYKDNLLICAHQIEFDRYYTYNDSGLCIETYHDPWVSYYTNDEGIQMPNYFPASYERTFYDAQGNKKLKWSSSVYEETYEYDEKGNLRRSFNTYYGESLYDPPKESSGTEDSYYYDDRYYIPDVYEEYDENGRVIYSADDGGQRWYLYDDHGNVLICKREFGRSEKYYYEYDSKGNIIHEVTSDGTERFFKYDENNDLQLELYIDAEYTFCSVTVYEEGRKIRDDEWHNNFWNYLNGNLCWNTDTIYKYDEHGNKVYSLGYRGKCYVDYYLNEYNDKGQLVRTDLYHNY